MGPKCTHKSPLKREARKSKEEVGDVAMEVRRYTADFEDGGKDHEAGNAAPLAGRGKEMDFPLEPPKGTSLAEFSPVNLAQ